MEDGRLFFRIVKLVAVCIMCAGQVVCVTYECKPNGTILVLNQNKEVYHSMTAGNNATVFNVTKTSDKNFVIVNATKNVDILITLSSRQPNDATGDAIVGGVVSKTTLIKCDEINDGGISQTLGVGVRVVPTEQKQVLMGTPAFGIKTVMWNNEKTKIVTVANLGEELKWEIQGPYEYDLLPTCTANAGIVAGLKPLVSIIQDGCSVIDMVSDFTALTGVPAERGDLISNFWAFKFVESEHLTISCSVKICTRGDAACAASCDRRRRTVRQGETKLPANQVHVVSHLNIVNSSNTMHGVPVMLVLSWLIIYALFE